MTDVDPEAELADATGELYGLDPADFVPARNALVRRLRTGGQRDLARRVADLRRPSPAAWAVNQLARRQRGALDELLSLGDTLRRAQTQTLAGADAALLRQAGRARREAVASLADSAVDLLAERGQGGAHHTEIAATLEAASLDSQAGAEVAAGRLTSALEPPSGFGDLGLDVGQPTADGAPSVAGRQRLEPTEPDPTVAEADPSAADAVEVLAEAERVATAATRRAKDLSEQARQATALADRRQQEVADAESDEARLQRDLDEARGRVVAGRRSADRARKAAESVDAAAAEADERRLEADQRVAELRAHRDSA